MRSRRHPGRGLLVALLVLLALLVVADRVAVAVAQREIASRVQTSRHLPARPRVHIGGFPFLTQVLAGRYRSVSVTATDVPTTGGIRVASVSATLSGVRVALGDVLHSRVRDVPADSGSGRVTLDFADLNAFLAPRGVTVAGDRGRLRVTGRVTVLGHTESVSADALLSVAGDSVTVRPDLTSLAGGAAAALLGSAQSLLTVTLPVPGLPFGVSLRSARVEPTALVVDAGATGLVLPVR